MNTSSMIEAQATAIGMLSVYNELFAVSILEPEHFVGPYQNIFKAMLDYYKKNGFITIEALLDYPGFDIDLYARCSDIPYSGDIKNFKRIQRVVIDKFKERKIVEISDKLKEHSISLDEYNAVYQKVCTLDTAESYKLDSEKLLESCRDDKKSIYFKKYQQLGSLLRLKENDFMVIAGATGSGKSGFALNLLNDLSWRYDCLYFNLEMVPQELHQRLISINCGLDQNYIASYKRMSEIEVNDVNRAVNSIAQRSIEVVDKSQSIDSIRSMVASHDGKRHIIVIIDHIGLIGSRARNSYERMTEIAKELRKISLDYNCTIIGLCQLNRDATKTSGKPKLSMLRDSGEIEQSASKILFVWHDDDGYSLVLEKNRSGPTGYIPITYNKNNQVISEVRP